ncbi:hypothetical protein ACI5KX_14800 [Erythrobacter sp. GH1-10]|uniref:hypothetical protein n=1 Tax=Erythrobacter sp. GH1-10 TaxID=3349334 RepID=UPI003877E89A
MLAATSPATAAGESEPVVAFLMAADAGNTEGMVAAMNPNEGASAKTLLTKLDGCYLRAVFGNPEGEIKAAWMCTEGKKRSRVVLANISASEKGAVVEIVREDRNDRPAPPRTGPAFDNEVG